MYEKLRAIRNMACVSAKEMAELLGLKTEAAYYKKESGVIRISIEEAKLIANKLGMSIEDIFFDNEVSDVETNNLNTSQREQTERIYLKHPASSNRNYILSRQ